MQLQRQVHPGWHDEVTGELENSREKVKEKEEQVMGPLVGQFNGREACKDGKILSLQADID